MTLNVMYQEDLLIPHGQVHYLSLLPLLYPFHNMADILGIVELPTNCFQGGETNRFNLAGFQEGDVGHSDADSIRKFRYGHFAFCQHHIQVDNNH